MITIPETLLARQKRVATVHLTLGYQERVDGWKVKPVRTDGWRMVSPFPAVLAAIAEEYGIASVEQARTADVRGNNTCEINFPPTAPPLTLVWTGGDVNYLKRAPDGAKAVIGNCDGEVLTPIQRSAPAMACPCNGKISCKPTINLQAEMVLPSHKKVLVGLESLSINFIEELIPHLVQMESREETQRLIMLVSVRNVDMAAWDVRSNASAKQQFVRPMLAGAVWMDRQEYVDAIASGTLPDAISRIQTASEDMSPVTNHDAFPSEPTNDTESNIINYSDHVPAPAQSDTPEVDEMYLDPFASL